MSNFGQSNVHASRRNPEFARLKTEPGSTVFWEGGEFGFSYEYSVGATPLWLKFSCTTDFLLTRQVLSCDLEAIRFTVWPAALGSETTPFNGDPLPFRSLNTASFTQVKDPQTVIGTGGVFTPTPGALPAEVIRIRTASSTAQRASLTGTVGDQRARPAGDYYLQIERLAGNGNAEGVLELSWGIFSPNEGP